MKIDSKYSEYAKRFLVTFFIMMGCLILFDLYTPIKNLLSGDKLNGSEILSYIEFTKHFPVVLAISAGLAFGRSKKSSKK